MAQAIGELVWYITGDNSNLKKSLVESEGMANKTSSKFSAVFKGLGFVAAAAGVMSVGKALLNSASDAEETRSKFGFIFSDIKEQAFATSKAFASAYGLSTESAQNMLAANADILTGLDMSQESALNLSTKVAQLSQDLVSFKNYAGGAAEANRVLSKALLGEREALEGLGIKILEQDMIDFAKSQNISWKEASQQTKAQLTYNLILERSKNAVGDAIRTQDSYANQQRRLSENVKELSANIGSLLLPAMTSVIDAFNTWFGVLRGEDVSRVTIQKTMDGLTDSMGKYKSRLQELQKLSPAEQTRAEREEVQRLQKGITQYEGELKKLNNAQKIEVENKRKSALEGANLRAGLDEESKSLKDVAHNVSLSAESWAKMTDEARLEQVDMDLKLVNGSVSGMEKNIGAIRKQWEGMNDAAKQDFLSKAIENGLTASQKYKMSIEDMKTVTQEFGQSFISILQSIGSIEAANAADRMAELDAQEQRALEAAGVAEETAIQKATRERDEALAAGKMDIAAEKEKEIKRLEIQKDFDKKRAILEYENNVRAWEFQVAQATSMAIQASLNAFTSTLAIPALGPILAPAAAAAATIAAGLSVAAVIAAKPKPPKFADGGIVPGTSFSGDTQMAAVNSGEMILNQSQQENLLRQINSGGGSAPITIYLGADLIYRSIYTASKNGELIIDARAVQA